MNIKEHFEHLIEVSILTIEFNKQLTEL
jgi:hypothetical protein